MGCLTAQTNEQQPADSVKTSTKVAYVSQRRFKFQRKVASDCVISTYYHMFVPNSIM